jgi:polysaccharide deacetylase 2 family uncharacterized protein YibQ
LAMIAISRLQNPRAAAVAGLAIAGVTLVAALGTVAALLLRPGAGAGTTRIALAAALAKAPPGWAQALRAPKGEVVSGEEIVRLWDAPPPAAAANLPTHAAIIPLAGVGPLPAAPIAGLFVNGPAGPLPIIAQDGRTPFDAYRRPFTGDSRPQVAMVIRGLGLNAQATRAAIETLPPQVTLSFVVYADGLQDWIDLARAHGHEVLLEAPMEPVDYPDNDPGPYTLMAQAPPQQIVQRLEWVLSRATGYFGVTNSLGDRFLGTPTAAATLATALRGRGLAFIDDGVGRGRAGGSHRASAAAVIDASLTPASIDQQLQAIQDGARASGQALGMAGPYPITLEKVAHWTETVEQQGFKLAPASALAAQK